MEWGTAISFCCAEFLWHFSCAIAMHTMHYYGRWHICLWRWQPNLSSIRLFGYKDRKVLPAIRTVVYGIGAVILLLYFFNEGLSGLWMWLKVVFGFGSNTDYTWVGNGLANILANPSRGADLLWETERGE